MSTQKRYVPDEIRLWRDYFDLATFQNQLPGS